ncbi:MAG TPA: hypothetical protein VGY56_13855 [Verrucomicrobiae bacterium]|nr:hypothetical protein [Verrucomicrobiae bacterium]
MAKSIRLNGIEEQLDPLVAPLSRSSFWEHWFEGHPEDQRAQANRTLDEHSIWEKAVNLEILAMDDKKY